MSLMMLSWLIREVAEYLIDEYKGAEKNDFVDWEDEEFEEYEEEDDEIISEEIN